MRVSRAGVFARRPFQVLLQVTNRCNMQCNFCDFWPNGVAPPAELTLADFAALEAQLREIGTFLVSIEGGEPFLRPDLVDIVSLFGRRHIPLLYTNGWYVDDAEGAGVMERRARAGRRVDRLCRRGAARSPARRRRRVRAGLARRRHPARHGASPRQGGARDDRAHGRQYRRSRRDSARGRSSARVGHCATLLSSGGFRRAPGASMPSPEAAAALADLWSEHTAFQDVRQLHARASSRSCVAARCRPCRAGVQSFNVDHVGNVSPCIEKIDRAFGNIKSEPLQRHPSPSRRGRCGPRLSAVLDGVPRVRAGARRWRHRCDTWRDLAARMRSL